MGKKGKGKVQELETESEEDHDSEEDALMELKLHRLKDEVMCSEVVWNSCRYKVDTIECQCVKKKRRRKQGKE